MKLQLERALQVAVLRSRLSQTLNNIFVVAVAILVGITTFMMGTQCHYKVILSVLRRPIGPIIGFLCQYGIMPGVRTCFPPTTKTIRFS